MFPELYVMWHKVSSKQRNLTFIILPIAQALFNHRNMPNKKAMPIARLVSKP